ncbi:MAG: DUF1574 domain-containing protein [Leptospira sp.]|nr:DUF1574 domain-containing protein [Leptospira sp.]
MKDKKFLLYPVLFLILAILVDKIFLLDFFKEKFLQKGNPVFYAHRHKLFDKLKNDPKISSQEKKFALALGDSRAYPFSNPGIPEKEKGKWQVYNFSGPQAVPMYSLLWYERILDAGIVPDMVFLAVSPEGFDDSKDLIYDPFIRLGMDEKFKEDYWELMPWDARYKYYIDMLFSFRKLQFDYKLFMERLSNGRMREYNPIMNEDMMVLLMGNGEYLAYAAVANVESKLKKDAKRIREIYLNNYQMDETQFIFLEKLLKLAESKGSKVFVVWPRVYKDYREGYKEFNLEEIWWSKVLKMSEEFGAYPINYNDDSKPQCDLFNDASHQSIHCFKEQMEDIFTLYRKVESGN